MIDAVLDWINVRLRAVVVALVVGCGPPPGPAYPTQPPPDPIDEPVAALPGPVEPGSIGKVVDRSVDFAFEGGQLEFELRQDGDRVVQIARSRYAVPVMIHWELGALENLEPTTPVSGATLLPAAPRPQAAGAAILLAELRTIDTRHNYRRDFAFRARFGDPRAQAATYAYGLPYPRGLMYSVLQGFHGAFSHRGSNEYAVDFDCPVATPVIATRDGVVVAANASAQGSGTTPDFLDYKRVNFVMIRHDDGTIGEYLHLSPSGIEVKPGQRVKRGDELALSGFTGFSSTPHLHFQVMTAAEDGIAARSFPFLLAVSPGRNEPPVQGRAYLSWE